MPKRWRNLGLLAGLLLAVAVLAGPLQAWQAICVAERQFRGGNRSQQRSALRELARRRTPRADGTVLGALTCADVVLRSYATYAIGASRRSDLARDLRAAWQREPDPETRSSMIYYWAQLDGRLAEPVLRSMLASDDPWMVLGAAKGLLRLGDLEAGERLLSLAGGPDASLAVDARKELQSLAAPLAGMIGQKVEIADARAAEWSRDQLAQLQAWWPTHVTACLLRDYLAWRNDKPDQWQKANLLLHEWKGRFGGFLRMSEPQENP